jgi:hypothetical protein
VSLVGKGAWTSDPVPLACLTTHGPWSALPRPVNPLPPVILPHTRLTMSAITLPFPVVPCLLCCAHKHERSGISLFPPRQPLQSTARLATGRKDYLYLVALRGECGRISKSCGFGKREKRTKGRRQMKRELSIQEQNLSLSLLDWALVFLVDSLIQSVTSCFDGELNVFGK